MRASVAALICMCLTACGGGGSAPTPVEVPNRAPTLVDPGALAVLEGTVSVGTISASDPDNNSLSFSISPSDDQALFSISSSGVLSFSIAPDFEAPADTGSDNVYDLTVQVSDGTLTDTQAIIITVTDAFEGRVVDAPIAGAECFIDLNGNNEQGEGEPSGTTNADGFFNVATFTPPEGASPKVVCRGGTDTKTGKALPGLTLISDVPADITKPANVTPLTTVVASVDTPEAKAAVLVAMGISGSLEDLLTNDGWAAAEAGDEESIANQRINQQVGLLLQTAATVVDDGDDATDLSVQLAQAVAKQISAAAVSDAGIDLTSTETLQAVLAGVVAEVAPEAVITADVIAAIARSVAAVNTVVSDPNLNPLSAVALDIVKAAQENLQTSVADVVSGDVLITDFAAATDTNKLFEDIAVAEDAPDTDEDGIPDALDKDDDGDGVADGADAFPLDSKETLDTDADGTGNNADTDDDGDGVADTADAFPLDKKETLDTDADGTGNNADTDDDADGILDTADTFPQIAIGERLDTDGDGSPNECDDRCLATGMTADADDDGDGVADGKDKYRLVSLGGLVDTDQDGMPDDCDSDCVQKGMTADYDDDNDGIYDGDDIAPADPLKPAILNWDNGNWSETKWQ